jgi:hypothetical protein
MIQFNGPFAGSCERRENSNTVLQREVKTSSEIEVSAANNTMFKEYRLAKWPNKSQMNCQSIDLSNIDRMLYSAGFGFELEIAALVLATG